MTNKEKLAELFTKYHDCFPQHGYTDIGWLINRVKTLEAALVDVREAANVNTSNPNQIRNGIVACGEIADNALEGDT